MKELNLQSPEVIKFDTTTGVVCEISHEMYTSNELGVEMPVHFSVVQNLIGQDFEKQILVPFDFKIISEDVVGLFYEVRKTIGQCSQIAEVLFDKLKIVNNVFKSDQNLNGIFSAYEQNYSKLDFMKHRDILSEIIKLKKIEWQNNLLNDYNTKSVTKSFCNFILDRNKYTHGKLMWLYPNDKTVIKYLNESKEEEFAIVNKEIINSYISCYKELMELLNEIQRRQSIN